MDRIASTRRRVTGAFKVLNVYWTAIVKPLWLLAVPIDTTTGTAVPEVTVLGTETLIW
jgi:hypothetical protein